MPDDLTIYHNPRCSKSRETLQRLRESGREPEIIEYRKSGLTIAELKRVLKKLDLGAHEIVRTKEKIYAETGLTSDSSNADVLKAIQEHPELLERPIVVSGDRAVIGRPPENVDELLG